MRLFKCAIAVLAAGLSACQHVPPLPTTAGVENPGPQPALSVTWLGTSTVTVSDGTSTVLIDAFISRPRKLRSFFGAIGLPTLRPTPNALDVIAHAAHFEDVDAIFLSHAHHDHALDAGWIAAGSRARVFGSLSAARVVEGSHPSVPFTEVRDTSATCVGQFRVRAIGSPHKSSWIAPEGDILNPVSTPARMRRFKAGSSFAFLLEHPRGRVLVIPSAVRPPDIPPRYPPADVVLLGIGMLGHDSADDIKSYWDAAVHPGVTRRVHPIHWDDFTRSLSKPLVPFPLDRVSHSIQVLRDSSRGVAEFSYLPALTPTSLGVYSPPAGPDGWCPGTARHASIP
ncbi:MBL fold metallo-hydrolase [Lysobacter humi (ex Lee et al. 2017)]